MSNEMNKEMSQGTDVQTEERYQVTKRDLRKTAARYNFMACNIFNYESVFFYYKKIQKNMQV